VIPVYAAGLADEALYLAMRFIDGVNLSTLIAREGKLDATRTIVLVDQIASGLDAAHRLGLVHRDIKPANIMVQRLDFGRQHAYVTDFGLVKQTGSRSLTHAGHLVGTLDYVAPEQIQGDGVDARTDVYGLGATLFHALSGRPPYPGDHYIAKLAVCTSQLRAPKDHRDPGGPSRGFRLGYRPGDGKGPSRPVRVGWGACPKPVRSSERNMLATLGVSMCRSG
jgi:serine/threonine-protein kinase